MTRESGEWAGAPYVRIYSTLARDHRRVWREDRLLAAYVRLLMAADMAWPGPAELPRWISPDIVADLVAEEVIDVEDDLYRFHGLDRERRLRTKKGQIGGLVRAGMAGRDSLGRFAGDSLDELSTNGDLGVLEEGTSELLDQVAGTSTVGPATPARPPASPPARKGGLAPAAPARPRTREAPDPNEIKCRSYVAHRDEQAHYWWEGVGWRCRICDAEDKANDQRSLKDRVRLASDDEIPF